ncbi:hypothetical protein [Blastococcus sp. CT_GayMR16]|uniref:hypothetical protein n=1 Tax=Blastococcus sp. CT_GayMR16 TaxID=2559607 RepID=UPI001073549E|nr:hypothetical protein [Blastococcus sp. CT_GayMR16]TFV86153.1 hypothetical protein E4P38_18030 [Blastococcus sp. CT_GayMR16]
MRRLFPGDVACWLVKTNRPPSDLVPGWRPGTEQPLTRCVRPSHRLDLMAAGQPCLLWLSGRDRPGVHALGELRGPPQQDAGGPAVSLLLTLLDEPVDRAELLADPVARDAEVLRMPAGSNPSWLSGPQYDAVLARVQTRERAAGLGPWLP